MTFPVDSSFAQTDKTQTQSISPLRKKPLPPAIHTIQNTPTSSPKKIKPVIVIHQSSENKSDENFPSKPHHRRSPFCIFTKDRESSSAKTSISPRPTSTFTPISSEFSASPSPSPLTGIAEESMDFDDSMEIPSAGPDSAKDPSPLPKPQDNVEEAQPGHRRIKQGYFYPTRSDFLEERPHSALSLSSSPSSVGPSPYDFSFSSHSISPDGADSRQQVGSSLGISSLEMLSKMEKNSFHRRTQNGGNYLFLPNDSVQPAHRRIVEGYLYTGRTDLLTDRPPSASSLSSSASSACPSPCEFSSSSHSVSQYSADSREKIGSSSAVSNSGMSSLEMPSKPKNSSHRRIQNEENYLFLPNDCVQPAHHRVVDGYLYTGRSDLFTPPSVSSSSSLSSSSHSVPPSE